MLRVQVGGVSMWLYTSRHPTTFRWSVKNVESHGHGSLDFHVLSEESPIYKCRSSKDLKT